MNTGDLACAAVVSYVCKASFVVSTQVLIINKYSLLIIIKLNILPTSLSDAVNSKNIE